MDPKKELNDLCKKIKDLIPSKHIEADATEQFETFISDLQSSGIKTYEIECIIRGYNYFNHILVNDPEAGTSSVSSSVRSSVRTSGTDTGSGSGTSSVPRSVRTSGTSSGTDDPQGPLSFEEQIQLLVQLYPIYTDMYGPINAMKTLADNVLTTIPAIDVSWIKGAKPTPKPDTIVGRVSYQLDMARKLNEEFVRCQKLIDEAKNVLQTATDYERIGPPLTPAQQNAEKEKVKPLMEKAQEKVKKEINQLTFKEKLTP
jgi:hypothetical protein